MKFVLIIFLLYVSKGYCQDVNLIINADFENNSYDWNKHSWSDEADATFFALETENAKSGDYFLTIENIKSNHSSYLQTVSVKPNTCYLFYTWIRTENIGDEGRGASIGVMGFWETSYEIKGTTKDWAKTNLHIKTGKNVKEMIVMLNMGGYGGLNTGKACFDDIGLFEIDEIPDNEYFISVNTKSVINEKTYKEPYFTSPIRIEKFFIPAVILILTTIGFTVFILTKNKKMN